MKVYLCSRIALDAHDINNRVAKRLRAVGVEVFVPHEQHYNQIVSNTAEQVPDEEIYHLDMAEMIAADVCVVVGRIGVDCGFEIGWFQNHGTPTIWYTPQGIEVGRHPMLYQVDRATTLQKLVNFVIETEKQKAGVA